MSQRWARHLEYKTTTEELQGLWRQSLGEFLPSLRASEEASKLHFRKPNLCDDLSLDSGANSLFVRANCLFVLPENNGAECAYC